MSEQLIKKKINSTNVPLNFLTFHSDYAEKQTSESDDE